MVGDVSVIDFCRIQLRRDHLAGMTPQWVLDHDRGPYILAVCVSCPEWVDRKELKALKAEVRRVSKARGLQHNLDHIVPITHPLVCGLTVPWNLKIIPEAVNLSKSNGWNPDQGLLFAEADPDPHQLCLL